MSSKAALKEVRKALDAKEYATAFQKAQDLVSQDPSNYQGYAEQLRETSLKLISLLTR